MYNDISIIKFTNSKMSSKNLINYESKEKGIIIYGRDIRVYMPDISIENMYRYC